MIELTKDTFSSIKNTEFSIVLFYANGCKWCEIMKPKVEELAKDYPELGFYRISLEQGIEAYSQHAEKELEFKYEAVEGTEETIKVPVLKPDGAQAETIKFTIPSFYMYHTKNATLEDELGFIGGISGTSIDELRLVCNDLLRILHGSKG